MPLLFLQDSHESLFAATDANSLLASVKTVIKQLEFEHFAYAMKIDMQLMCPQFLTFSGFPAAWSEKYISEKYFDIDPVVTQTMRSSLPLLWNEDFFTTPKARQLHEEAAHHGLSEGITLSVREQRGFTGIFSMARSGGKNLTQSELVGLIGRAQLLATTVHAAFTRIELPKIIPEVGIALTGREQECLCWAADGKTAWEIGQILNIAERTAIFHLKNCVRKLGATNKTQAIVRAISLGIFDRSKQHEASEAPPPAEAQRYGAKQLMA